MTRSLKIETARDFYRRKTFPKDRMQGQWFARAGFTAGERVELVIVEQEGRIELRAASQPAPARQLPVYEMGSIYKSAFADVCQNPRKH